MTTWFFGASSDWSQRIISKLDGQVIQFSRSINERRNPDIDSITVNYGPSHHAKLWIEEVASVQPKPNRVIFNFNTTATPELDKDMLTDVQEQYKVFGSWWENNKQQLFFRTLLLNWLSNTHNYKGDVVHITSQISTDHNPEYKHLQMYKTLRAVDYEIIWNNRACGMNAYGICPASNRIPQQWADYIAEHIQSDEAGKHWLYGVAETDDPDILTMIKYNDWEKE